MIDSVVLQLNKGDYTICENNKLEGVRAQQGKGFIVNSKYCKDFADKMKKDGLYFPVITLPRSKSGKKEIKEFLEIQVSLPKLVYGSNIYEIDYSDLDNILNKLLICLKQIGIETNKENLKNATLKRVDFSKIILLPEYLGTSKQVIKKLAEFNYKPSSDFDLKEYNNNSDGITIKFYNKTQGYAIYDKFGEIINNGYTLFEKDIIKALEDKRLKKNVIKFEFAHQRKQSLEAFLRKRIKTKSQGFTLPDVLQDKNIAKDILLEIFDKVYSPATQALITLSEMQENRLEQYLRDKNLPLKKRAFISYLVNKATKIGAKGLFEELREDLSGGSYDRLKKEISLILVELGDISQDLPNLLQYLRAKHDEFKIIKPES
ncbi:MAG TPA: hypothetical protein ENN28_00045 [Candidatus Uhrbacteria bacterium]|nr:hypothetical protein [Candidatus Uhrbacteria bacterium]